MPESMPPYLEIQKLYKYYGSVEALCGVDLALIGPQIHGFLGPNGAGKTTTIKAIAGLIAPTKGQIRIGGVDTSDDPIRARKSTGIMMETPFFYNHLTGRDNLRLFAKLSGLDDGPRIDYLLGRVGLTAKARAKVSSYSRGMRQRLGLAAALLDDPRLLVLDEPTNGLDPAGIVEMRQWLAEMTRDEGRAVLLSSHQMGEMERVCDSFTIINQGMIVASGSAAELAQPQTSVSIRVEKAFEAARILRELVGVTFVEVLSADRLRADSATLTAADVNRFLVSHGVDVLEISEGKESLEEIFFRLIGRSSDVA